jgi:hypothetical protein
MTRYRAIGAAVAFILGSAASAPALAHGSSVHFGFGFGFPVYPAPYYYPPPAYYYPPPVYAAPAAAPVYVEPPQAQAAPQAENFWYYCPDSKTYYPYVKSCASAWQRVKPQPPGT